MIGKTSGNEHRSVKGVKWLKVDGQSDRSNAIVKLDLETKERALSGKAALKDDPKFGKSYINKCRTKTDQDERRAKKSDKTKHAGIQDHKADGAIRKKRKRVGNVNPKKKGRHTSQHGQQLDTNDTSPVMPSSASDSEDFTGFSNEPSSNIIDPKNSLPFPATGKVTQEEKTRNLMMLLIL